MPIADGTVDNKTYFFSANGRWSLNERRHDETDFRLLIYSRLFSPKKMYKNRIKKKLNTFLMIGYKKYKKIQETMRKNKNSVAILINDCKIFSFFLTIVVWNLFFKEKQHYFFSIIFHYFFRPKKC